MILWVLCVAVAINSAVTTPLQNEAGSGNNGCFDVALTTKVWASEISWSVGSCRSNRAYTNGDNNKVLTQECCLSPGDYTITCKDSYGDGWHGGYLEINGERYCESFTTGTRFIAALTSVNTIVDVPACTGGDSCCQSYGQCGAGEGDCDYDSVCKPGLKCGQDNCDRHGAGASLFQTDDDCCWKYEGYCDCDYSSGGCKISYAPNLGYGCDCTDHGVFGCEGESFRCTQAMINRGLCQGNKFLSSCFGDCGGY